MLHRFPPLPSEVQNDASFLSGGNAVYAKLKREKQAGKRTVLMTEHTLIFVVKGVKLLHLPEQTVSASPGEVILLRKGIYAMAEYIEDGLDFEALMLFLPAPMLNALAGYGKRSRTNAHHLIFPATAAIHAFKDGLRSFFQQPPAHYEPLLALKQQEIILLLLSGIHGEKVQEFIHAATSSAPADIDYVLNSYLLQPVTIAELAALCNCSLAKFKRDFQQRYQCPPRIWINKRRLQHAHLLLQHTDKQVTEIAFDCGFENASYFIRLFKAEYGFTPAAARAKSAIL